MQQQAIQLSELRIKIDQLNEKIISGLKTRSRFALNSGTFSKIFIEEKTWFEYRLKKEQDLDSEYGRFLYFDQQPMVFSKDELAKAKIKEPANNGFKPVRVDVSAKIIALYREVLGRICKNEGDDFSCYGETTKLDVENILTLNERIVGLGEQVIASKLASNPEMIKAETNEEILSYLVRKDREEEVIRKNLEIAERYGIEDKALIEYLAKQIILITCDAEIAAFRIFKDNFEK